MQSDMVMCPVLHAFHTQCSLQADKTMASESKQHRRKQQQRDEQQQEGFSVPQFLLDEVELPFESLALDLDMRQGQIRTVNTVHRDQLVQEFEKNPPNIIDLTTVLDQGVTSAALVWQLCVSLVSLLKFLFSDDGNAIDCFDRSTGFMNHYC